MMLYQRGFGTVWRCINDSASQLCSRWHGFTRSRVWSHEYAWSPWHSGPGCRQGERSSMQSPRRLGRPHWQASPPATAGHGAQAQAGKADQRGSACTITRQNSRPQAWIKCHQVSELRECLCWGLPAGTSRLVLCSPGNDKMHRRYIRYRTSL